MTAAATQGDAVSTPATGMRFPCFDGLRAIAATAVILTHVSLSSAGNRMWGGEYFARLDAGVAVFFVISGFLLYRPFVAAGIEGRPGPAPLRFFWRRFLRIYPAYWLAVTVIVYIAGAYTIHNVKDFVLLYGLLHIYSSHLVLNAPVLQAWTLALEVSFYVFLPFYAAAVGSVARRSRNRIGVEFVGIGVLVVTSLAWRALVLGRANPGAGPYLEWLPAWLDLFAAGMLVAVVSAWITRHRRGAPFGLDRRWAPAVCWGLAAIAFWAVSTQVGLPRGGFTYTARQEWFRHTLYGLTAFFLILPAVFGAQNRSRIRAFLRLRFVVAIGVVSYGLYLWHEFWVGRYLAWTGQPFTHANFWEMLLVVSALAAATATISYFALEKPALRLKNWMPRWLVPPAAPAGATGPDGSSPRRVEGSTGTVRMAASAAASPSLPPFTPPPQLPWWHPRRFTAQLGLVALGALIVRVGSVLTIATKNPTGGDALYYHVQAKLLAAGKGFADPFAYLQRGAIIPTAVHPPLYPLALSLPSLVGLDSVLAHQVMSCVIGAAVAVVVGLIARRVGGDRAGVIAALVAAVYPNLWLIDGVLLPEGLFALTVGLTIVAAYRSWDRPTLLNAAILGAAIGAAALSRGEGIFLLPLLAVPILVRVPGAALKRRLQMVGAAVLVAVVVLAPWTIRNELRFERPILLSTNTGDVLAQSNCNDTYYGNLVGFWSLRCGFFTRPTKGDESVRSALLRQRAVDFIDSHKGRVPVVVAARVARIWEIYQPEQNAQLATIEGRDLTAARVGLYGYYILAALALGGLVVLTRRRTLVLPLVVPFVFVTLTVVLTYAVVRFRAPAEVALTVLAGVGIDALIRRARPRRAESSKDQPLTSSP